MQIKSLRLFPVALLVILLALLAFGCGKQGSRFANQAPSIEITSYEGFDPDNPYTDSTEVTLFQQRIYWHASDTDGTVTGYAYRILDANGDPVSTSGNAYIDSLGEVTPQEVIEKYGTGWILHYQPGANQDYPLDDPRAARTIWSTRKFATINFPAADAQGDSIVSISRFEVICVDNRGAICEIQAFRRFQSYSMTPVCNLSTTRGNPNGAMVGTGLKLSFTLSDEDPFLQPTAWFYEFKVRKVNIDTGEIVSEVPADGWISTINEPRINQYKLTKYTYPSLSSDYSSTDADEQITETQVLAKVTDLAGIESEPDTITFAVKEGFKPKTIVYRQRTYALGNNHYIDYTDSSTPEVWPYTIVGDKQLFATPFFRDIDGYYTAVNSSNLKIWLRWGWHGEYGQQLPSGGVIVTDNPYDKKIDLLLDDETDSNYYSEITHFDIRLNNSPYNYPPLANSIVTDTGTGKQWLRVPVNSQLGQTIVLTQLPANTVSNPYHLFEVRAVDLQDEVGTTAEFRFKVVDPVPKAQKSGILVIDDEINNSSWAPEDSINAKYAGMLADYNGTIAWRTRTPLDYTQDTDIRSRKFALSDIQNYKLIIYHSDIPSQSMNFQTDQDAFALYLSQGGNMIVSGGANLHSTSQGLQLGGQQILRLYFGLSYRMDATSFPTNNMSQKTWFVRANPEAASGYNQLDLAFDLNPTNPVSQPYFDDGELICPDPNESFLAWNNNFKGLGPVTFFDHYETGYGVNVTPIYRYGSKPVYTEVPSLRCPATEADYNSVNNKLIGIKRVNNGSSNGTTCYLFGIPLSYLTYSSSRQLMNSIISELGL